MPDNRELQSNAILNPSNSSSPDEQLLEGAVERGEKATMPVKPDIRELQNNAAVSTSSISSPDKLEDAMWHLNDNRREGDYPSLNPSYPDRPGEPDCKYYLRTGLCSYGTNCRYNHPAHIRRNNQFAGELPERVGQPDCPFFLKTGTCKFGASCKYHHPRDQYDVRPVLLNIVGLPMRQDEKSCPYYMRTGSCKFGPVCKFNHPQPATYGAALPITGSSMYGSPGSSVAPSSGVPLIGGFSPWPLSKHPYMSNQRMPAYVPFVLPNSQGAMPVQQGWSTYTGTGNHVPSTDSLGNNPLNNPKHLARSGSSTSVNLPERPDQPDCLHYLKTGSCKYGTSCKYHHPKEKSSPAMCMLGPFGLPLRPGHSVCSFYSMYGSCKYGSACRFDHPLVGYYGYSLPALSVPDPSTLFPNQKNSLAMQASAEISPSKTLKLPDRHVKIEASNDDQQDSDDNRQRGGAPAKTTSPLQTVPSSESIEHSD